MKMDRMIVLFMDYCQSKQLRPKTMKSYEQTLRLFEAWLRDTEQITEVEHIREATLRAYLLDLQSRGKYTVCADERTKAINHPQNRRDYDGKITNITINNYLRNLRVFFTWLVEIECLAKSPMRRIRSLPEERPAKEFLTDEEVLVLMKSLDKSRFHEYRDLMIAMVTLDSGTRLGETLSMEMDQLNLTERSIRLPADKTKGRKERAVFFSLKTAKELRRWLQFKDRYCDSPYVFPVRKTARAMKASYYEANFRGYLERAKIKKGISPSVLRNNFAKRCLMFGMDIYTLSRLLGHSSVTVTEKAYLDINDEDLRQRYSKFSPIDNIYFR